MKCLIDTVPLLNEGFPYALQAMGITNENGKLCAEDGGDMYTLALELNKRDITYSGHPQLAVDVLGEDEPMLSEMKCDVVVC